MSDSAWCNSELFQSINTNEITISWIRRVLKKKIATLVQNQHFGIEMGRWRLSKLNKIKYTCWMLWRQGYSFNSFELRRLLVPKFWRTIIQVDKNIFYDIDKDKEYRLICLYNRVLNNNHRLIYSPCSVKYLKLFSIRSHVIYYSKWSFDVEKIYHRYWNNKNRYQKPEKIWN